MSQPRQNDAASRPMVSAVWALAAVALLLAWQFLTVHYNRGGNWTALFLVGQDYPTPPELVRGAYHFPGSGYDGELYRIVAHDLFMQRGYSRYLDVPAHRYRRFLVPALAFLLVAGREAWIDASYIAVIALFVFLGAYWLSRWAAIAGFHPAWALAFPLVPATLISIDRMTVDVALAAFTVAFAVYWKAASWWKVFIVLLLGCLVRETGLLLVGGACLFELLNRRFGPAALWACAALPTLTWYLYLLLKFPDQTNQVAQITNKAGPGIFYRLVHPPRYPLPPLLEGIARFADELAMAAILLACILTVAFLVRGLLKGPLAISGLLFTALVFVLGSDQVWIDVNAYARIWSPLLILVALPAIAGSPPMAFPKWLCLLPAIGVDLRIGTQFASAIGGVIRGLLHL